MVISVQNMHHRYYLMPLIKVTILFADLTVKIDDLVGHVMLMTVVATLAKFCVSTIEVGAKTRYT